MHIFSAKGKITPAQDKTNVRLCFTVPKGVEKLTVNYRYSPKHISDEEFAIQAVTDGLRKYDAPTADISPYTPVPNLVTLSFDENGAYRGACHRQPSEQVVIIASGDSTPGIYNRPLTSGQWDVVLNVHYAGCDIDYTIDIEGGAEQ